MVTIDNYHSRNPDQLVRGSAPKLTTNRGRMVSLNDTNGVQGPWYCVNDKYQDMPPIYSVDEWIFT